jgi:hypothetical protein
MIETFWRWKQVLTIRKWCLERKRKEEEKREPRKFISLINVWLPQAEKIHGRWGPPLGSGLSLRGTYHSDPGGKSS